MWWVGLTGGIASGKSTVAKLFKKAGVPVADADELARLALAPGSPGLEKVLSYFGTGVLDHGGNLDRRSLGSIVFGSPEKLLYLESLIHPWVQEQVARLQARFASEGHPFAIYDVPLLFEKNREMQFDRIIVVGCSLATQLERLQQRNRFTIEEAEQRVQNQLPLEEKMRKATDVIWNEGNLEELELQVQSLIQKFRNSSNA